MTMPREKAAAVVLPLTTRIGEYAAVAHDNAKLLLNDVDFARLQDDPIRSLGPRPGFVYPWNVIDYLAGYRRPGEQVEGKQHGG